MVGWGFLLQSSRGCGDTGATVRDVLWLPLGSTVVRGRGGVAGGTRLGGCGEERRGGAGGGTGSGAVIGAVRCGTGGGCGGNTGWICGGGGNYNKTLQR